jgi:D-alanine-D-alanine ligase
VEKVIVLHNCIPSTAKPDDLDNLAQTNFVSEILSGFGYEIIKIGFSASDITIIKKVTGLQPKFVFNLVEAIGEENDLSYIVAPFLLELTGTKFTGCGFKPSSILMNKLITKRLLIYNDLPTPKYISAKNHKDFSQGVYYIMKPTRGCASLGLDDNPISYFENVEQLDSYLAQKKLGTQKEYFAELFIDGREFRVTLIGSQEAPIILPPIELEFGGFELESKMKIYGYKGKWIENSFEFQNIRSIFPNEEVDKNLIEKLVYISKTCWDIFDLRGYAAIDFRVDNLGQPFIVDVNTNPCLVSHPGGIMDASAKLGLSPADVIAILTNAI